LSEKSRALPNTPNLRFLKVEAKRRLAAGEFTSLHDAQLSIAREHGFSSWTALKLAVEGESNPASSRVRWLVARFADARGPEWTAPDDTEIRAHFQDRFLDTVSRETLITSLRALALPEPAELAVKHASATRVQAQLGDLRIEASAEADPPHRFDALRIYPLGERITDPRVADPRTAVSGDVPVRAIELGGTSVTELGLPGLILAGGTEPWALAHGWADLVRHEPLRVDHRFPAYGITKLITSTVVLRLVAAGRVDLDAPANNYLRSLRLADNAVTVKEVLTHTGGVVGPSAQFDERVPDQVELLGEVVAVERRGTFKPSNAGYAVLGQLAADVCGSSLPDVAGELVLTPLRMGDSSFPASWPASGTMRGHRLAEDGTFEPTPQVVYMLTAAGGMWTTAADLLRFGKGWSTLLPAELAADAVRPHAAQQAPGADVGLGWLCNTAAGVYGHPGAGRGSASSLIVRADTGAVTVAATNRLVPVEPVNAALNRPI
jgi:CubicO group peptidase (beta-lactamase class C family)